MSPELVRWMEDRAAREAAQAAWARARGRSERMDDAARAELLHYEEVADRAERHIAAELATHGRLVREETAKWARTFDRESILARDYARGVLRDELDGGAPWPA